MHHLENMIYLCMIIHFWQHLEELCLPCHELLFKLSQLDQRYGQKENAFGHTPYFSISSSKLTNGFGAAAVGWRSQPAAGLPCRHSSHKRPGPGFVADLPASSRPSQNNTHMQQPPSFCFTLNSLIFAKATLHRLSYPSNMGNFPIREKKYFLTWKTNVSTMLK